MRKISWQVICIACNTILIPAIVATMLKTPFANRINKLFIVLGCLLGSGMTLLSAQADDTEVFFSSVAGSTLSQSNILFILDNSGSMGYDYNGAWRWGSDFSTPQNYPAVPNKMSDLQSTMSSLLADIQNVNIGLMTFTLDCLPSDDNCTTLDHYAELIHNIVDIDEGNNRASLQNSVASMLPRTYTPITAALYEATMVMRGGKRGRQAGNYPKPILSDCQQNHIVLLSDGNANQDVPKTEIENLIGANACGTGNATGEYCATQLASWLNNTDHRTESAKLNPINVHTIAFDINTPFLSELADAGGGGYKQARDGEELVEVFENILKEVKDVDTTFVSPVTSTDQLNRLSQSDDLYFGMYSPSLKPRWPGNLKRYTLDLDNQGNVVIKDGSRPPKNAISEATGFIADDARSIWSSSIDGPDVTLGGAASKISHVNRNVYTYLGGPLRPITNAGNAELAPGGNEAATKLHKANSFLSNAHLGVSSWAERNSLIDWARGVDTENEYDDPSDLTDSRKHIGDILHSNPVSVNYDHPKGPLIFFGTNEGFLHAINSSDGTEEYSFIPRELLGNLRLFRENNRDIPHPYGLDGPITIHHLDNAGVNDSPKDADGVVNNGELAWLYFGMRRGGRDYYAMDISSRNQPKLSWQIKGGIGDFAALGQTWSQPTPARIRYKGAVKHVLIFGGGYDENQDSTNLSNLTSRQSPDTMGNAVYIVDATNGRLIWRADSSRFSEMNYSIPSDVRVLDIDADGLADRLYVGDMGGQLWRFDINSAHSAGENANTLVYGGVMAKLAGPGNSVADARRFYSKPDVALISKEGQHFMSISIGSGWRAHPLNKDVEDRFYMVRDNRPMERITDSDDFGAVNIGTTTPSWRPTRESDLRDVTLAIDTLPAPDQEGWMLRLNTGPGEKLLNSSITINNQLVFATYTPGQPSRDVCLPADDNTNVYAVDILRGNPVLPLAGGETASSVADRKETIVMNGIPPAPSAVIKENSDGTYSTGVLLGTKPILQELSFSELTKRIYWQDRRRGTIKPEEVEERTCSMTGANESTHNSENSTDSRGQPICN